MSLIVYAARFANKWHEGVNRKYTGRPYITHPARVAGRVSYHPDMCEEHVAAAWLHDVLEDCDVSEEKMRMLFGDFVTSLVVELTNPSKGSTASRTERKRMDLAHISTISKAGKIIKMIDRIDNLNEIPLDNETSFKFLRDVYFVESVNLYKVVHSADSKLASEYYELLCNLQGKILGEYK